MSGGLRTDLVNQDFAFVLPAISVAVPYACRASPMCCRHCSRTFCRKQIPFMYVIICMFVYAICVFAFCLKPDIGRFTYLQCPHLISRVVFDECIAHPWWVIFFCFQSACVVLRGLLACRFLLSFLWAGCGGRHYLAHGPQAADALLRSSSSPSC